MKKQIFLLENLDCANCANKIEQAVGKMPNVKQAQVVFATQQLRITSDDNDIQNKVQNLVDKLEPGVVVHPIATQKKETNQAIKKVFILEDLDCANCANKVEQAINKLPNVEQAQVVFATKQLRITSSDDNIQQTVQTLVDQIEPGITVVPTEPFTANDAKQTKIKQKNEAVSRKKDLKEIIAGAVLFGLLMILNAVLKPYVAQYTWIPTAISILFLIDYLFLGWNVLFSAAKNITKGQIFDENFLMAVASIGAFVIGEHPEAVAVILFYRIGSYFESLAVNNSRKAIADSLDMRPEKVERIENNQAIVVPIEDVVVGDILQIKPGERVPIDGVCISGQSQIDTSPITGESKPVSVEKDSEMISGCINKTGVITMKVTKPLEDSMVTRILSAVEDATANKPKVDRFITRFSKIYTPAVCLAALIVAIVPPLLGFDGGNFTPWIQRGLTFLVVSCPCALVISVPMTFFAGIGRGSREGILFKGGSSIEMIKEAKVVAMDKTGTITVGKFETQEIITRDDLSRDSLLQLVASVEQNSTHPIAQSLVETAKSRNINLLKVENIQETAGRGLSGTIDGKTILAGNEKWMNDNHIELPKIEHRGTAVYVAEDNYYIGLVTLADAPKEDAKKAIEALKKQNLYPVMLTGDNEETALEIAREVGITEVHAQMHPDDKLAVMRELREKHGPVMFIGDGINDAPVLAGADVSAAMGSGADAAIEAADVVILNSKMFSIVKAFGISKKVMGIAMQNIVFALGIKLLVMVLTVFGISNMWMAVFADVGVSILCILNAMRLLKMPKNPDEA